MKHILTVLFILGAAFAIQAQETMPVEEMSEDFMIVLDEDPVADQYQFSIDNLGFADGEEAASIFAQVNMPLVSFKVDQESMMATLTLNKDDTARSTWTSRHWNNYLRYVGLKLKQLKNQ